MWKKHIRHTLLFQAEYFYSICLKTCLEGILKQVTFHMTCNQKQTFNDTARTSTQKKKRFQSSTLSGLLSTAKSVSSFHFQQSHLHFQHFLCKFNRSNSRSKISLHKCLHYLHGLTRAPRFVPPYLCICVRSYVRATDSVKEHNCHQPLPEKFFSFGL